LEVKNDTKPDGVVTVARSEPKLVRRTKEVVAVADPRATAQLIGGQRSGSFCRWRTIRNPM